MYLNYSQPDFYKFNEDSVGLSKVAINYLHSDGLQVLDLMAGCGVIGLELLSQTDFSGHLDFLELQKEFKPHLEKNLKFIKNWSHNLWIDHFNEISLAKKYDLITCNPPYFHIEENRSSPNPKKNRCRMSDYGEFKALLEFIVDKLSLNGVCVILMTPWQEDILNQFDTELKILKRIKLARAHILCLSHLKAQ